MEKNSRTLIIGIDGGSFDILDPLMSDGYMPHLVKLIQRGVRGNLISTTPPITGPAWCSFATGCNPGKHGVVDFVKLDSTTRQVRLTETVDSALPTIWNMLSRKGYKVGVMGVPMTYPASKVNGFLLSGLMTPPSSSQFCYPVSLKRYLVENHLRWPFSEGENANPKQVKDYIGNLIQDTQARTNTALHLLNEEMPDFVAFVFGAADPLQHQYFNLIKDESHPAFKHILKFYRNLDRQIGRLLDWVDEDALIIVMSDHGFGPLKGFIHLNNWLLKKGYLVLRNELFTKIRYLLHRLGYTPENLYHLARRLGIDMRRRLNRGRVYSLTRHLFLSFQNVDWEKTQAYALGHIGQVYIQGQHLSKEDYRRLRDKLKEELLELSHPITNKALIASVFPRRDIYTGPFLDQIPDLLLHPDAFEHVAFGESEFASNQIVGPALHQGHHRMEGILIMAGPGIKDGQLLPNTRITDIMPTVLYNHALPIPTYLDGELIESAFEEAYLRENKIEYIEQEIPTLKDIHSGNYDDNDEKQVRARLKKLGYLA